jgi:hypothetical protein
MARNCHILHMAMEWMNEWMNEWMKFKPQVFQNKTMKVFDFKKGAVKTNLYFDITINSCHFCIWHPLLSGFWNGAVLLIQFYEMSGDLSLNLLTPNDL